jgi:hypothetical protein
VAFRAACAADADDQAVDRNASLPAAVYRLLAMSVAAFLSTWLKASITFVIISNSRLKVTSLLRLWTAVVLECSMEPWAKSGLVGARRTGLGQSSQQHVALFLQAGDVVELYQ